MDTLPDTVRVLGATLLHFLWQGALIGLVTAGVLRAASRRPARDRYLICLGALLACLSAPVLTAWILIDRLPSALAAAPVTITVNSIPSAQPVIAASLSVDVMHAVVGVWLLGVLSIATYYLLQWRSVNRLRRWALPMTAPAPLVEAAARLLREWKVTTNVPLMLSELVSSPIVIGVWRPMIVFPAATIARMPVADFELILLHEMAHIIRRDTWTNAVQVLLEIVFFYHPVVHWISRRARLERECACDDFVVASSGSAYQYARALTSLAGAHHHHQPALTMGAASGDLLPRLRYLAGECIDGDAFPRTPLQLALLALLLGAIWLHALLSQWQTARDVQSVRMSAEVAAADRRAPASSEASPSATPMELPLSPVNREYLWLPPPKAQQSSDARQTSRTNVHEMASAGLSHEAVATDATRTESSGSKPSEQITAAENLSAPTIELPAAEIVPLDLGHPETAPAEELPVGEAVLTPVFSPQPEYPVRARLEGIEGSVSAVVRIAPDGRTRGLQIVDAQPLGVFEGNVRRALMQWRYEVPAGTALPKDLEVTYQLRFTLSGVASTATGTCATATASRTCVPH